MPFSRDFPFAILAFATVCALLTGCVTDIEDPLPLDSYLILDNGGGMERISLPYEDSDQVSVFYDSGSQVLEIANTFSDGDGVFYTLYIRVLTPTEDPMDGQYLFSQEEAEVQLTASNSQLTWRSGTTGLVEVFSEQTIGKGYRFRATTLSSASGEETVTAAGRIVLP